jgi:alkylation response protein AidB-like acyl-CoA dehydrogenase
MNLDFNEEQNMLRDTTQAICEQYYDLSTVREAEKSLNGFPVSFWQAIVDSGLTGVIIPEDYGGAGMGLLDAVVIHEELGRHLAASPLFVSCFFAAKAIELFGDEQQKSDWLKLVVSGDAIISVAQLEVGGGYEKASVQLKLKGGQLLGRKILVPFANVATQLLVLARDVERDEIILCLVDAGQEGIDMTLQPNIASGSYYNLSFNNCRVIEKNIFRADSFSWERWQQVMSFAAVILAAESVGGAERMLDITAEYAKTRVQFGKAIGAFQSLSHYMAELAVEVEGGKVLNYQAAWAQDNERHWLLLAAQAKLQAGDCFRKSTAIGTQIHGGLGFTAEADPQLYFRRAKSQQLLHWDPVYLEARIATLLMCH